MCVCVFALQIISKHYSEQQSVAFGRFATSWFLFSSLPICYKCIGTTDMKCVLKTKQNLKTQIKTLFKKMKRRRPRDNAATLGEL